MQTQDQKDDYDWVGAWHAADTRRHEWTVEQWKSHFLTLSKRCSYMLRHGAAENGLIMRSDGFIPVRDILAHKTFRGFSKEDVEVCVEHNTKKRFLLSEEGGELLIRAQQGHTKRVGEIDQRALTTPLTGKNCPSMAVHGTFSKNIDSIKKQGLKTMGRDHIHMATGLPGNKGVISGCREGTSVFLHIDVKRAIVSGIEFFLSGNDVILTPGRDGVLPPEFIKGATDATGEKVLFGFETEAPNPQRASSSAGQSQAAPKPDLALAPPSHLNSSEKSFLKAVKGFRAILKIEEQQREGKIKVDKTQLSKLEKKGEFLADLAEQERGLPLDSPLREKNKDVLSLLPAPH